MESRTPTIIDLTMELAKLTMFHGLTPSTTREERRGSGAVVGQYRDGIPFVGKFAGTTHWEDHAEDELISFSTAQRPWISFATTGRRSLSSFVLE